MCGCTIKWSQNDLLCIRLYNICLLLAINQTRFKVKSTYIVVQDESVHTTNQIVGSWSASTSPASFTHISKNSSPLSFQNNGSTSNVPVPRSPREDTDTQDAAKQKTHEPGQDTHVPHRGREPRGSGSRATAQRRRRRRRRLFLLSRPGSLSWPKHARHHRQQ